MIDNDIKFYDFDFNLLYILPPYAENNGYSSVNVSTEFNGEGNLEITFRDNELKQTVINNSDSILVVWRDFQGYITSYMFTETTYKIFGKHLNGLVKRAVIPIMAVNTEQTAGYILDEYVLSKISWINAETNLTAKGEKIQYSTDQYMSAGKVIQEINKEAKSGYLIEADFKNKQFIYHLLLRKNNNLMLSVANLNIYDPELTYENTDMAFGGWYEKESDSSNTWTYITNDSTKTGINKIDVVLSATTAEEAQKELNKCISDFKISVKTKNLMHGIDYNIGDIIRVQTDGITEQRLVSGINMWNEQTYGEEPILSEI